MNRYLSCCGYRRLRSRALIASVVLGVVACGSDSQDANTSGSDAGLSGRQTSLLPEPDLGTAAAAQVLAGWCAKGEESGREAPDAGLLLTQEQACDVRCAAQASAKCENDESEAMCLAACLTPFETCNREQLLTLQCSASCGVVSCGGDGVSEITGCDDYVSAVLDCVFSL